MKKNDIVYKKSGNIFNQHTYWTKQPISGIEKFIEKYTLPGDLILDPFCGTGMTGLASSKLNRDAYLVDNSPAAIHIAKGYMQKITFEKEELDAFLNLIKKDLRKLHFTNISSRSFKDKFLFDIIGEVYLDSNGDEVSEAKEIFLSIKENKVYKPYLHKDHKFHRFKTLYKFFINNETGKKEYIEFNAKIKKNEDEQISEIIKKISNIDIPETILFGKEPKRNYKKGIKNVSNLYSEKNLYCLLFIKFRINQIENKNLKAFLYFCFSSIVFNCSLLSRYRKYENTSVRMGTFFIPKIIKDNNVISAFENKTLSIFKAKKMIDKDLKHSSKTKIKKGDATDLKTIKTSSIDFIYTDPPYGDVINYSELNVVFESWLGIHKKYKNEMIINKQFGQSEEEYFRMFKKFLKESSRVLKKNKFMILIFHHPDISLWGNLQKCIFSSNFLIKRSKFPVRLISESRTASQYSTKKRTQGFLALELVNFKKTNNKKLKLLQNKDIHNLISEAKEEGYTSESDIYDYFISSAIQKFNLLSNPNINDLLK